MQFCNLTGEWCDTKVYSWLCKIRDEWVAGRLSIWVFENDKKKTNLPLFALSINPFVRWRPYLWDLFFCFKGPALCLCCSLDIFPFLQPQNNTTCKLGWWNLQAVMWQLEAQHFVSIMFSRGNIFEAWYSALWRHE